MAATSIEWTQMSWSPVVGCTRVSAGCDHCYAVSMTRRLAAMGQAKYAGLVNPGKGHFNGVVRLHEPSFDLPLRWRKPRRIFVNPMSDLFDERLPSDAIDKVFAVMAITPRHTYQILTKRPQRMFNYLTGGSSYAEPLPNVHLGVSVENQAAADERIPLLLETPAAVRFLSVEPLLDGVVLYANWLYPRCGECGRHWYTRQATGCSDIHCNGQPESDGLIDWVIVGGESGPGARPMDASWARSLRDQCQAAGVAFHFKQWGGRNKKQAGRELDGRTWDEIPGLVGNGGRQEQDGAGSGRRVGSVLPSEARGGPSPSA